MDRDGASPHAVIVSGGIAHDFDRSSDELVKILDEYGFSSIVTEDVEGTFTSLTSGVRPAIVVMNLLRFTLAVEKYAHLRDQWGLSLTEEARNGLTQFVAEGGGLLAMHGATICFDDWPEWPALLGAQWEWDRSSHPPLSTVEVCVQAGDHPIIHGIKDFQIEDEVYGFMRLEGDVEGLLHSAHSGVDHPLLWARTVESGRVVYDALGHHDTSLRNETHRTIVGQAALWASQAL